MNSTSEDIKDMLVDESSLGLTFATNLFIGKEPVSPDDCVTIYDTFGGGPSIGLDGQDTRYEYPAIQIRVRNTDYVAGWTLIQNIMTSLHARSHETWNDTLYTVIYCSSGPALLDWDDNGKCIFIVNFNVQRR